MLSTVREKIKDRDLSLGAIMVIIGVLIWIIPVKLVLSIFVLYGIVQIFWKKEEAVEEHHHHHHHNGQKKKVTRKKKSG